MRRRLVVAIASTVLVTLVAVGLGTIALSRLTAREESRDRLVEETDSLGQLVAAGPFLPDRGGPLRDRLRILAQALRVADAGIVVLGADGSVERVELPDAVDLEDIPIESLVPGVIRSDIDGDTVWAALLVETEPAALVIVTADEVTGRIGPAGRWFLVAGGASLVMSVFVASLVARRLAQPLRSAQLTAARLADGDLSARVPSPAAIDPTEVGEVSRAINSLADALERSRNLERQFLLSISHDLRTPLTSIRGYAEAITDGATNDPRRAAEIILSESQRLERLVRDLLDLSRLESHRFELKPRDTDLGEIVRDAVSGFEHHAASRDLALSLEVPDHAIPAFIDPERLGQVLANLLENACRYARSSIVVSLTLGSRGQPMLTVRDDGPGISPVDLPHVFERLYTSRHRPESSDPSAGGSGLGLAIVRELVTAMGGEILVESTPDLGTAFVWSVRGALRP